MPADPIKLLRALERFGQDLTAKFTALFAGQPEDQLKSPVERLLVKFGAELGFRVLTKTEAPVALLGRPDFAVAVANLLTGHVELKVLLTFSWVVRL